MRIQGRMSASRLRKLFRVAETRGLALGDCGSAHVNGVKVCAGPLCIDILFICGGGCVEMIRCLLRACSHKNLCVAVVDPYEFMCAVLISHLSLARSLSRTHSARKGYSVYKFSIFDDEQCPLPLPHPPLSLSLSLSRARAHAVSLDCHSAPSMRQSRSWCRRSFRQARSSGSRSRGGRGVSSGCGSEQQSLDDVVRIRKRIRRRWRWGGRDERRAVTSRSY